MKRHQLIVVAAAVGIALTGCASTHSSDETADGSSTSSGTMRRADSTNPDARNAECVPGDDRQNCPPDSEGAQTRSQSRSSESATDVETPQSGAPVPR
jgi:hypothetical protein